MLVVVVVLIPIDDCLETRFWLKLCARGDSNTTICFKNLFYRKKKEKKIIKITIFIKKELKIKTNS